ncbi:MAG: 30S ribosome-binding factor RbfA [Mycoplasmataceae bacterium]|nr:30S ribosome-binding factor RbfA [Mycoplasmataceae bacterium]
MQNSVNKNRNESLILNALNYIIKNQLDDPKMKDFSITYVDLSRGKYYCAVYITHWKLEKVAEIVEYLNKNKGIFKSLLAKQLSFYKIPDIVFKKDNSIENAEKIEELFKKIKK